MIKKSLWLSLCLSATYLFAGGLYTSDFFYSENARLLRNMHDKELSTELSNALKHLQIQRANGEYPAKHGNFVIIKTSRDKVIYDAFQLERLGFKKYVLVRDEQGNLYLLTRYADEQTARKSYATLKARGFNVELLLDNQKRFWYYRYTSSASKNKEVAGAGIAVRTPIKAKNTVRPRAKKQGLAALYDINSTEKAKCDIVRQMQNKTFYNPHTKVFTINGEEYEELPQEYKICGIAFVKVDDNITAKHQNVDFDMDDNRTITGSLDIPDDEIDALFFYRPDSNVTTEGAREKFITTQVKKPKEVSAICDFTLPNGIRTGVDSNGDVKRLPATYKNQKPTLFYEERGDIVKLANSGFAEIFITADNFNKNCKKVGQQ